MHLLHTHSRSGKGNRPDQFRERLAGIAIDAEDRLLAVGDREVKRFSRNGKLEIRFPTRGAPWSIAADEASIWIGMRGAVDRFDYAGKRQDGIEDQERLGHLTGLAVHGTTLFVADATNRAIHVYKDGKWQGEVGHDVNTRGFMLPNGVLDLGWDAHGNSLLVAHPQKHRVERYDLDGKLTARFGRFGMDDPADFGGCCNPTNITTTPAGLIVVSEKAPPRVKVYAADGQLKAVSVDGLFDSNTKNIDLAADRRGQLYATDPLRCTIEVFALDAASE